ncbi:hypothetical protein C7445_102181 [Alicyclobacillus sacchari]|uniref:Spore germination protein GerPA/GerPF n=2 Tax=Alicyclobacillus sacchari TaxID=392010 RepID=A0A4R8LTY9_9BACL|nr:hypothetical protein C7445_102181 [Alicyclobacillus sacchari]GMA55582.1 hypothetical protein GCM10025858_00850 [Alicyclobacillus sacchari]
MMTTPRTTWLPVQLQIDSVQSSSAVNVGGQNIVYGLSAHSKSNTGFGDLGSHSVIAYNKTLLNDADAIDTPIDDRDVHVLAEHHAAPMETHVAFQGMNISSMQQNAGVFVGDSRITGWDQHQKTNKATGDVYGDHNEEVCNVNINFDTDVIDAFIRDDDVKTGLFSRAD